MAKGGVRAAARPPSRELGSVGDLLGIDERQVRGDLPCHDRVPGTAQLLHELAAAGSRNARYPPPDSSCNTGPPVPR